MNVKYISRENKFRQQTEIIGWFNFFSCCCRRIRCFVLGFLKFYRSFFHNCFSVLRIEVMMSSLVVDFNNNINNKLDDLDTTINDVGLEYVVVHLDIQELVMVIPQSKHHLCSTRNESIRDWFLWGAKILDCILDRHFCYRLSLHV